MKKHILFFILLMAFSTMAMAQETKKVGVLPTVNRKGNVNEGVCLILQSQLAYAVTQKPGYEGYDRVDMGKIIDELDFQRTGLVSDDQIKELGKLNGVDYLLIAEVANYDINHVVITAKILNAETARLESTVPGEIASTNPKEMRESCMNVANMLLGGTVVTTTKTGVLTKGQDFYYLDGQRITDERYVEIIQSCPEAWLEYERGGKLRKTGRLLLFGGPVVCAVLGIIPGVLLESVPAGIGMGAFYGGIPCIIASIPCFISGKHKKDNAYKTYNQYCSQQSSVSLSFGPATQGIGVGCSINF
ncbi:MAG: hypothetical protein IKM74_10000 [Bacteroidales bacterium]|nr:hypothetical protein [Bacteroidales bacterium]